MPPTASKRPLSVGTVGEAILRRWPHVGSSLVPVLVAAVALATVGCRGGMKSFTAPKWPGFGDTKSKGIEAPALAAAPTTSGPIQKPSAGASPYPTSSTPAGYVVADPVAAAGTAPGVIQTAATDPPAVTYGVTPAIPAPGTDPVSTSAPPMTPVERTTPIAPQVGPYASLPAPPAAAETAVAPGIPSGEVPGRMPPGLDAPSSPPSTFPATAGYEPARGAAESSFAPAPPAPAAGPMLVPVAPAAVSHNDGVDARYASRGGSRFGSGAAVAEPLAAEAPPAPAASAFPATQFDAPTAAAPPAPSVAVPAPVLPAPASLPPQNPDGLTAPPVRRPDPVFRPGGTSSYRPAEQIFADDATVAPSPVRTASFEVVDPPPAAGSGVLR